MEVFFEDEGAIEFWRIRQSSDSFLVLSHSTGRGTMHVARLFRALCARHVDIHARLLALCPEHDVRLLFVVCCCRFSFVLVTSIPLMDLLCSGKMGTLTQNIMIIELKLPWARLQIEGCCWLHYWLLSGPRTKRMSLTRCC